MVFLAEEEKEEFNTRSKSDFYLAQIACMIHNANCEKGRQRKVQDFLIEFGAGEEKRYKSPGGGIEIGQPLDEHWQQVADRAKRHWAGFFGGLDIRDLQGQPLQRGLQGDGPIPGLRRPGNVGTRKPPDTNHG